MFCVLSWWDLHTLVVASGTVPLEGLLIKYKEGERDRLLFVQQRQYFSNICPRYFANRDICSLRKWLKWILQFID